MPPVSLKNAAATCSNVEKCRHGRLNFEKLAVQAEGGHAMVRDDWVVGGERRRAASERIYAAAMDLIAREGLDAFTIDALAARVHCSRATIYRYAGGQAQIRDEVLMRLFADVVDTVRLRVDGLSGSERVITAIDVALEQIRTPPIRRLTSLSGSSLRLGDLHSSPIFAHLAAELTGITESDLEAAQWIVRLVVSFAIWPADSQQSEQRLLRLFVAPAFDA